jgi:uncharacterized protein DUF5675
MLWVRLRLPWRRNQNEISAIPAATFNGTVREHGDVGWRIVLEDSSGKRKHIQIHLGNCTHKSTCCVLLGRHSGSGNSLTENCTHTFTQDERHAVEKLGKFFGTGLPEIDKAELISFPSLPQTVS